MSIAVPVVSDKEAKFAGEAITLLQRAKSFQIETQEDAEQATDAIKVGNALLKKADAERLEMTKPFRDGVDALNRRWSEQVINPLKEAIAVLRERAEVYLKTVRQQAEDARRHAAEAEDIGDHQTASEMRQNAIKGDSPVRGNLGSTLFPTKTWTYDIVDLSRVPLEYLMVDDKAIKAKMADHRTLHGTVEGLSIPGIEFRQVEKIAVR